jgi:hypothetical protein
VPWAAATKAAQWAFERPSSGFDIVEPFERPGKAFDTNRAPLVFQVKDLWMRDLSIALQGVKSGSKMPALLVVPEARYGLTAFRQSQRPL